MCTGAEIPTIIAAVSAAAQGANSYAANRRSDAEAARGIMEQARINREASQRVNETIQQTAKSDPTQDTSQRAAAYTEAIRRGAGTNERELPVLGAVSSKFAEDVTQARDDIGREGVARAGLTASVDAPFLQRQREANLRAATASDLSRIENRSAAADYLARLRASIAGRQNPWINAAAQIGQAYSGAAARRQGWEAGNTPDPVPNSGTAGPR